MTTHDNGTNDLAPEGPESSTSRDGMLNQDVSRRKFLRTAVVGTAGIAGAAGVAGIVLSQHGSSPSMSNLGVFSSISTATIDPYLEPTKQDFEITSLPTTDPNNGGKAIKYSESFWLSMGIQKLDAGSYSIYVQQVVTTTPSTNPSTLSGYLPIYPQLAAHQSSPSSQPFAYQAGTNVQVNSLPPGTISSSGPYQTTQGTAVATVNQKAVADQSTPVTFTLSSQQDVLFFLHISWGAATPTATEYVYLKIVITNTSTNVSVPAVISITANPAS